MEGRAGRRERGRGLVWCGVVWRAGAAGAGKALCTHTQLCSVLFTPSPALPCLPRSRVAYLSMRCDWRSPSVPCTTVLVAALPGWRRPWKSGCRGVPLPLPLPHVAMATHRTPPLSAGVVRSRWPRSRDVMPVGWALSPCMQNHCLGRFHPAPGGHPEGCGS